MKNVEVEQFLDDAYEKLVKVNEIICNLNVGDVTIFFLTQYAIIKSCGAIEHAFKNIIADVCSLGANIQGRNVINKRVRYNSSNPRYDVITNIMNEVDTEWGKLFKIKVNKMHQASIKKMSLNSLVEARNSFAHGGNPTITINDVLEYYSMGVEIIKIMDKVIEEEMKKQ